MTSTPLSSAPNVSPTRGGERYLSRAEWVWIALLAGAFIALHWSIITRTYRIAVSQWGGDWSHALAIPFISIYYIYTKRDELAALPRSTCWPGLLLLFAGIFSFAFWIAPGRNDMFQGYSMIVALFGVTLFVLGPAMMRVLWFPILFLVFAVKVSDRLWENIAAKLQLLAAHSATVVLNILGIHAEVHGSTIDIYRDLELLGKLNVAEACSGLRMLMAFVALGVAVAFIFDREWWQRLVMVLFTVPIAIAVNVGRVTVMGVLYVVNPELSAGDFHKFVGLLMLFPALALFLLLGWVLDQILIRDDAPSLPAGNANTRIVSDDIPERKDWIVAGLIWGSLLTLLVGACYFLLIASVRPGFLGTSISLNASRVGLALGLTALIATLIYAIRYTRGNDARRCASITTAISGGVLFSSVLGIHGILWANEYVLHKEPVPLREQLFMLPAKMGDWEMISEDPKLSDEMLEALGTTLYLSRHYGDTSHQGPGSVVKLHLAYYTGTPDTVPHVPERCWVAAGIQHLGMTYPTLTLPSDKLRREPDGTFTAESKLAGRVRVPADRFNTTVFTFGTPSDKSKQSNVVYFFLANGKALPTPDRVRAQGFDPRDKYAYYCKVEVGMFDVADPEEAVRRASAFLSAALPEILACLPDWHDVQAGLWPPENKRK